MRCRGGAARSAFGATGPRVSAHHGPPLRTAALGFRCHPRHIRVSSRSLLCVPHLCAFRPTSLSIVATRTLPRSAGALRELCMLLISWTTLGGPALTFAHPAPHRNSRINHKCDPRLRAISRRLRPTSPIIIPLYSIGSARDQENRDLHTFGCPPEY
jgi:hypothetical protein